MKNILKTIVVFAFLFLLIDGCNTKNSRREKIQKAEETATEGYDTAQFRQLLETYHAYVNDYPQDSLAPEYLFRAGRAAMILQDGKQALTDFANLIKRYPKSEQAVTAFFYRAYTYENVLYDMTAAAAAYKEFLKRYPDDQLAESARMSLKYLGMEPEEILAAIQKEHAQ
ncbi:MAG: tetratricopeptide repeat protein [Bacteroidales bacterium]|jgi:outer membrane protein assembly factor BamD (BamD/ComL family)|nr:tetratricopeptide repeat protein [Bacteroidales bacterium]